MTLAATASFGTGGEEPYAHALRASGEALVTLAEVGAATPRDRGTLDVARWHRRADTADLELLRAVDGPVIDIGCGPGRMVRAAQELGLDALGIDVSAAAVAVAVESGASAIQASVFDALPREGEWQTALLVDGNVGIGGDVLALLRRCRRLLRASGELVVETHPDVARHDTFLATLSDAQGRLSERFPWAQIGVDALRSLAPAAGFASAQVWESAGRSFCRLALTAHAIAEPMAASAPTVIANTTSPRP